MLLDHFFKRNLFLFWFLTWKFVSISFWLCFAVSDFDHLIFLESEILSNRNYLQ
jgi:hypothetical protein